MSTMIMMLLGAAALVEIAYNLDYAGFGGYPHNFFTVNKESVYPTDLFFKDDGTRMYVISSNVGDKIIEYNLDVAWDVRTAKYSTEMSVGQGEGTPLGLFIGDNGTKLYVAGDSKNAILQYDLNPAWDISSASYVRLYDVSSQTTSPRAVNFKPDGSRMFVLGEQYVYEYSVTSNWNISAQLNGSNNVTYNTALYTYSREYSPTGMFWKSDGSKLFVIGTAGDNVEVWNTPGNWSLLNTSHSQASNGLATYQPNPQGVAFSSDGSRMYAIANPDAVFQYDLSTAWDVGANSLTYGNPTSDAFYVGGQSSVPQDVAFKDNGTRMYILDDGGNSIDTYSLTTPWDVNSAYLLQSNFSVSAATSESVPTSFYFGDNGSKLFILGRGQDTVYRFDLNTAWNLGFGATLNSNSYYVGGQETNPYGLVFSPDGLNFFICGSSYRVKHYSLSTAWDLTASNVTYEGDLFVGVKDSSPQELEFNDDGTVLFVLGQSNGVVYAWQLHTPYSLSGVNYTSDFIGSFCVVGAARLPSGLAMKPDGSALYVVGTNVKTVFAFNIRQEPAVFANISTATSLRNDTVNIGNRQPQGIFFNPDGTKLYQVTNTTTLDGQIYECPLSQPWNISSHGSITYTFNVPLITGTSNKPRPQNIFIAPDGKNLYYASFGDGNVFRHTLSTAWYLNTISANYVHSYQTSETQLKGLWFSPDGKYMFVHGFNTKRVRRYTLSTPWDITTASANQNVYIDNTPLGLSFSPHGDKMYVADNSTDSIRQWNLSEPWDLTGVTSTNEDDELDLTSTDNVPVDIFLTPNGRNAYIVGSQHDTVFQYAL